MDECGNNKWDEGNRADNATDVVYLFLPLDENKQNSFPKYGVALVEVEVDNAVENELSKFDSNKGKYKEYVVKKVPTEKIVAVYIPKIFKERMRTEINDDRVTWCDISLDEYDWYEPTDFEIMFGEKIAVGGIHHYKKISPENLDIFAKTANFESTVSFNFFRGINPDHTVIDVYNVRYGLK